jgi:hypothetical protein
LDRQHSELHRCGMHHLQAKQVIRVDVGSAACASNRTTRFVDLHCLPVRPGDGGCSFQLGRTSMCLPRLPHFAQTTLLLKYGNSVSAA